MRKWENIRAWINKNDSSFIQFDNYNLTILEVIGFLLFIASFVIYILHDKTGFKETWLGWLFLISGLVLTGFGIVKNNANDKNT